MRWQTVLLTVSTLILSVAAPTWAQDQTRPATTTFWGDTGLWFVPTGEVLPTGHVSLSLHRTERDFQQGNTNVSFWPVTGAVGLGRVELFGSLRVVTRIDRDTEPLLFPGDNEENRGLVNEYPNVHESWTGNRLGDLFVGGKLNLASQERQQPLAMALRGTLKFPTGDRDEGAGTGEYDGFFDVLASREFKAIELAGYGGYAWRGDPADLSVSDGVRWGAGAGFPTRRSLRASAEVYGEWMLDKAVMAPTGLIVGTDGSLSPPSSLLGDEVNTALGLTWQHSSGLLLGAAANYRFGLGEDASGSGISTNEDGFGMEFRIGFHSGVKVFVPPPPPALAQASPPPAVIPTPAAPPAPAPPPPAPVASAPAPPETVKRDAPRANVKFEDVHFDFDSYRLRRDALPLLEPAIAAMKERPLMRLLIEGHTCSIGTAEYNLALGERRANSVRAYLIERGVDASRLSTVSYGEEHPAYDNSDESTRRLNRRAVMVIRMEGES